MRLDDLKDDAITAVLHAAIVGAAFFVIWVFVREFLPRKHTLRLEYTIECEVKP